MKFHVSIKHITHAYYRLFADKYIILRWKTWVATKAYKYVLYNIIKYICSYALKKKIILNSKTNIIF